ncbi:hypothetical protein PG990_002036 [Apiospora arundinis]
MTRTVVPEPTSSPLEFQIIAWIQDEKTQVWTKTDPLGVVTKEGYHRITDISSAPVTKSWWLLDPRDQGALRLKDDVNVYAMFDDREDNPAGSYEAWVVGYTWVNSTEHPVRPVHPLIQCALQPAEGDTGKLFCQGDGGYVKLAWCYYRGWGNSLAMSRSEFPQLWARGTSGVVCPQNLGRLFSCTHGGLVEDSGPEQPIA